MIRALVLLLVFALALVACDRYIDLSPPPDAHHHDGGFDGVPDSVPPDATTHMDGGPFGDAFVLD